MWRTLTVCVVAGLLSACSSGGPSASHITVSPSSTSETSDTSTPTDSESATDTTVPTGVPNTQSATIGSPITVQFSDDTGSATGSFKLTVGKPLTVAEQPVNHSRWLGIPVTVESVTGSPVVADSYFGIGPVATSEFGTVSTASVPIGDSALDRTACDGMPDLESALSASGGTNATVTGYNLPASLKRTTGCVVLSYESTDKPTTVSYYMNGLYDATTEPSVTWRLKAPATAVQPPSGIVYAVSSDGGINDVTYATANFGQAQDTAVSGNSWTTKIPNEGVSVATVLAQNAGDGTITCTITIDGKEVAKQSSHGQYAIVTCTADNS
jgi:hypothetical protein